MIRYTLWLFAQRQNLLKKKDTLIPEGRYTEYLTILSGSDIFPKVYFSL